MKQDALTTLFLMAGMSLERFTKEEEKRLRKALNLFLQSVKDKTKPPGSP